MKTEAEYEDVAKHVQSLQSELRAARRQRYVIWAALAVFVGVPIGFASPYVLNNDIFGVGTISSSVASGSNAVAVITNGARIDFGAGASDYASSDGTTVTYAGPLTATGLLSATGAAGDVTLGGGDLTSSLATQTFNIISALNAATASATVAAITLAPSATLDANDLVVEINSAAGTSLLSVDLEGDVLVTGSITSGSTLTRGTITLASGTGTATVLAGAICTCTDTAATPVILRCNVATTTLTASEVTGTSTHAISYICL